jgi:plasmid stabilization system protein ParE
MPPPLSLSFSLLSENDFEDILLHSTEQWGEEQTIRYVSTILTNSQRLLEFPQLGRLLTGPKQPTRALQIGATFSFIANQSPKFASFASSLSGG